MSNPVFTQLENGRWGQSAVQTQPRPSYDQQPYDPQMVQAEQMFHAPSADAIDRGRMTMDDVMMKTLASFAVLVAGGALGWWVTTTNPATGTALMTIGLITGFILVLVNSFSKKVRPALILAYALAEGLALGTLSMVLDAVYPGIVVQALIGTGAVFGVTLALFASNKVRNSSKLMRFTMISMIGIVVWRVLDMILSLTGALGQGLSGLTLAGIPLGVVVGLFAVLIGAACLIQDFDVAKQGVAQGAPKVFAWQCAFGLMVTVVWMYVEILRLLSYFRQN